MAKVVDFSKARKHASTDSEPGNSLPQNKKKKSPVVGRDAVLLWQLSQAIDDAIRKGVLEQNLKSEEIAAILAHRLGTLIATTDNTKTLTNFCVKLLERLTGETADTSTNAS